MNKKDVKIVAAMLILVFMCSFINTIGASLVYAAEEKAELRASVYSSAQENTELEKDEIITQTLTIRNISTQVAKNVVAEIILPEGLECVEENKSSVSGYQVCSNTIVIGDIGANKVITKPVLMRVKNINDDIVKVETNINIKADNTNMTTSTVKNTIVKSYFSVMANPVLPVTVLEEGTSFEYTVSAKARSLSQEISGSVIEVSIPGELNYKGARITEDIGGVDNDITANTQISFNNSTRTLTIDLGTLTGRRAKVAHINVEVGNLPSNTYSAQIELAGRISGNGVRSSKINSGVVTVGKPGFSFVQTSDIIENSAISASEDYTYIFEIENLSSVALRNVKFTDILPKEVSYAGATITSANGSVANKYDTDESGNPIVIFTIKGNEKVTIEVAVTANPLDRNTTITNQAKLSYEGMSDVYSNSITNTILKHDIEMPETNRETNVLDEDHPILVKDDEVYYVGPTTKNTGFDLKLDMVVSKITLQDSEGTTVSNYNNVKLAKKDIVGKKVNDSTIIVEYKLLVTNNGSVPGYAKKIMDYMPKELKFNSELNPDWYTLSDGNLCSSVLSDVLINPGETKVVTLLLTKKMNEEDLGVITNKAEINETFNDLQMQENKQNNTSSAEILITVKTGDVKGYVAITIFTAITVTTVLTLGIYLKKRKA